MEGTNYLKESEYQQNALYNIYITHTNADQHGANNRLRWWRGGPGALSLIPGLTFRATGLKIFQLKGEILWHLAGMGRGAAMVHQKLGEIHG